MYRKGESSQRESDARKRQKKTKSEVGRTGCEIPSPQVLQVLQLRQREADAMRSVSDLGLGSERWSADRSGLA